MSEVIDGTGQREIASTRLTRMAALAGTGAKVGVNYLKYYGRRTLTGETDKESLHAANAAQVYKTFSQLKGGPLKIAQMLSIDQNLLPRAYVREFSQAQYSAPPLSYPLVVRVFRREFGRDPLDVFDQFEPHAAHGASIGQVHRAEKSGGRLAVKVQYPGVADSLRSDLRAVKPLALQVLGVREADVGDYFREVEERLVEETDYALELRRSVTLSAACAHLPNLRFPEYYPEWSSPRILTMSWLDGVPLDRFADSGASQDERDTVGQALWDFYDFQVHQLHLFHADPHPGNFLVDGTTLCPLDFGCTKQLEPAFYRKQFRFLDPALLSDPQLLETALADLEIVLAEDSCEARQEIVTLCQSSLALVAEPFRHETFDFGAEDFMRAVYEMGLENGGNERLRALRGRRGSPHSVYVNRVYFGLYTLLCRLRARVRVQLPDWIGR